MLRMEHRPALDDPEYMADVSRLSPRVNSRGFFNAVPADAVGAVTLCATIGTPAAP